MLDLLNGTIDAYSLTSYGSESFLENPNFRPIMMFSNTKHKSMNVNVLPQKMRDFETKNWIVLFGKNLSEEQQKKIYTTLHSKPNSFYTNLGVWYRSGEQIKWNK
jgi:hypothetical protein